MTAMRAYYATAATIYAFWLDAGFSPAQAAGLLAQADAESSLNPKAVGDHDKAFGLHQWHSERLALIKRGCGIDLKTLPPLADQLKAALWELEHPENGALLRIRMAKTAYEAGYDAARFWERPGSTLQYQKRGDKAEAWAVYFAKHPVKP
jgi:Phage tail lysozyme